MNEILDKLSELSATQREMLANQVNQQKVLDKHSELLEKQGETLLRNTITVEEHHKRSTALESEFKRLDGDVSEIKEHVTGVRAIGKFIKWAGFIAGTISAIGGASMGILELLKRLGL